MGLSTVQDPYQEDEILNSILEEDVEDDFGEDVEDESAEEGEMMEIDNSDSLSSGKGHTTDNVWEVESVGLGNGGKGVVKNSESSLVLRQPNPSDSKCKRKRKSRPSIDVARFVQVTCEKLEEPKKGLIWNAVHKLGLEALQELLREVDAIEVCGGQMTADGKRRRSPGGVLWNIVRARVSLELYKDIMNIDKTMQKKRDKDKRKKKLRKPQQPSPAAATASLRPVSHLPGGSIQKTTSASVSNHHSNQAPLSADSDLNLAAPVRVDARGMQVRDICTSVSLSSKTEAVGGDIRGEGGAVAGGLDAELNRKLAPGVVAGWRQSWAAAASAVSRDEVEVGKDGRKEEQDGMEGVQIPFGDGEGKSGEVLEEGGAGGLDDKEEETGGVQGLEGRNSSVLERLRFPVKYEEIADNSEGETGDVEEKVS